LAGAVAVSVGEAGGVCAGELDGGAVVGGGLVGGAGVVGEAGVLGDGGTVPGVVDGALLDGDGDGVCVAEGGADDVCGVAHPGAGCWL